MSKPIGLTRAEEEREQQQPEGPRVVVAAPPGVVRCKISVMPNGDDCPAAATVLILWFGEGDEPTPACLECAQQMSAKARQNGTTLRVKPLQPDVTRRATTVDNR